MDKIKFKKLLFDVACSAMACDYDIDDREIRELKYIEKSTTYFEDIDLSRKLDIFIGNFKENPEETIENIIGKLKESFMNPVEEMLVLEIVLRLVYADTKIEQREINFIQSIRSCLSIDDEIITERFGVIKFLVNFQEKEIKAKEISKQKDNFGSVDMTNLENLYFSIDKKKKKK